MDTHISNDPALSLCPKALEGEMALTSLHPTPTAAPCSKPEVVVHMCKGSQMLYLTLLLKLHSPMQHQIVKTSSSLLL